MQIIKFNELEPYIKTVITISNKSQSHDFKISKRVSPTVGDTIIKEGRKMKCVEHKEDVEEGVDWIKLTFIE